MFADFKESFPQVTIFSLSQVPVRVLDLDDAKERKLHESLVDLVDKMLEAKSRLAEAQTDKDRNYFDRYCELLNDKIDDVVYELYGISGDERKVIEGETN